MFQMVPYFIVIPAWDGAAKTFVDWDSVMETFALFIGFISLLMLHGRSVSKRREGWYWSAWILVTMVLYTIIGIPMQSIGFGVGGAIFEDIRMFVLTPLSAAMYASLGFWIASAAYRAFRARTVEAAILLISGTIVMLANAPVGGSIWGGFAPLKDWIFDVPNMSTMRGITIGAALGALALGARTLMGKERGYLRGGGE
ncbi:MAG: hypothetical protein OEW93_01050 [Candidatus Bathyarchaeota archaeon]|nr:hypothetical protein [Candidatus Bathyarchaeota archaeon]